VSVTRDLVASRDVAAPGSGIPLLSAKAMRGGGTAAHRARGAEKRPLPTGFCNALIIKGKNTAVRLLLR
jgi:hypothetical protein